MRKENLLISYYVSDSQDDLQPEEISLLETASESAKSSYSPYSRYKVGSAVLLSNGKIVTGSNQENMAFPSGLCAERVALFAAVSNHPGILIKSIAITARSEDFPVTDPVTPCGACRQALIEYENNQGKPIRLILGSQSGKTLLIQRISDLLPLSFREEKLKK
jgi:cytidine deaminase